MVRLHWRVVYHGDCAMRQPSRSVHLPCWLQRMPGGRLLSKVCVAPAQYLHISLPELSTDLILILLKYVILASALLQLAYCGCAQESSSTWSYRVILRPSLCSLSWFGNWYQFKSVRRGAHMCNTLVYCLETYSIDLTFIDNRYCVTVRLQIVCKEFIYTCFEVLKLHRIVSTAESRYKLI